MKVRGDPGWDRITDTTVELERKQTKGPDATLADAAREWEEQNPQQRVVDIRFIAASPGRPGEGRWVTLRATVASR